MTNKKDKSQQLSLALNVLWYSDYAVLLKTARCRWEAIPANDNLEEFYIDGSRGEGMLDMCPFANEPMSDYAMMYIDRTFKVYDEDEVVFKGSTSTRLQIVNKGVHPGFVCLRMPNATFYSSRLVRERQRDNACGENIRIIRDIHC